MSILYNDYVIIYIINVNKNNIGSIQLLINPYFDNIDPIYLPSPTQNTINCSYNYCKLIDDFTLCWIKVAKKFNLSTTPKVHIIIDHLCDYFDETELPLIKTSDEIVENCHQQFNRRMQQGYKIKNLSNPAHGKKLYDCVRCFNSYNLKINQ